MDRVGDDREDHEEVSGDIVRIAESRSRSEISPASSGDEVKIRKNIVLKYDFHKTHYGDSNS